MIGLKNCTDRKVILSGLNSISRREFLLQAAGSAVLFLTGTRRSFAKDRVSFKIGFIIPEQGPHHLEAQSLVTGFELFLSEHPTEATSIEILKKNSGKQEENTLEALAELLMKKQVTFLVCPPSLKGSEHCIRASFEGKSLIFISNPTIRLVSGEMCLPPIFRIAPNNYQMGQPLASWAVSEIGTKAFITGDNDVQGNEQADFFALGFEKVGGTFVDRVMTDASKIKEVLSMIHGSDAEFVFAGFKGETARAFLNAVANFSSPLKQKIIGPDSLVMLPNTSSIGNGKPISVTTLSCLPDPVGFAEKIKLKMGREPADLLKAAEGYDLGAIVTKVLREVSPELEDVTKLIRSVGEMNLSGSRGDMKFDKNHEPIFHMLVRRWEISKSGIKTEIVKSLGPCQTPDFGCGRIGFPVKPDAEIQDEDSLWDQTEN